MLTASFVRPPVSPSLPFRIPPHLGFDDFLISHPPQSHFPNLSTLVLTSAVMATLEDMSAFDFDPRNGHFHYNTRMSWPLQQHEPNPPPPPQHVGMPFKRSTSPLPLQNTSAQSFQQTANLQSAALMSAQWQMTSQGPGPSFALDTTSFSSQQPFDSYGLSFQASPTDYMPPHTSLEASMDANMASGLPMDPSYLAFSNNMNQVPFNWQELNDLMAFQATNGIPDMTQTQPPFQAPSPSEAYLSDTHLEVRSLTSSNSDNGWGIIEHVRPHYGTISHPEQTLHPRTFSDSSYSDVEQHSGNSWDGFVEVPNAISSPGTESAGEFDLFADRGQFRELERPSPPAVITTAVVPPIAIRQPSSSHRSPTSPVQRRQSRKNPSPKSTKTPSRRPSQVVKTEVEKRVGRRKGPLRPEQRKGAGEIRKLGACLRCKFLKKTVSYSTTSLDHTASLRLCSAIREMPVQVATLLTRDCGKYHVLELTSRILDIS